MANMKTITINGVTYNIVDQTARDSASSKAPGGYGYGEHPVDLGSTTDDTAFVAALDAQFANTAGKTRMVKFTHGGGTWTGTLWNAGNNYGELIAYSYAEPNVGFIFTKMVRTCKDGVWSDWEYENPPMKAGVEYRTTDRLDGKVVYKKLVDGVIRYRLDGETEWNKYSAAVGAAPSGYGWGETSTSYNPPYGDPDSVDRTCVFSCSQGNIPRGGVWRGVAQFQNANNGQMVVRSYTNGEGVVARRYKINGEWKPWEYENPWMTPGTEYRTTELWNGKPVYIKLINYGKLAAANTTVTIPLGCTATNLVDFNILITLSSGSQYSFPVLTFGDATPTLSGYFAAEKTGFVVKCHADLSTATAVATVKYTKD